MRKDRELPILGPTDLLEAVMREGEKGLALQRYKGLGEMNPEQLWETTLDPEARTLLQVRVEHADEADEIFTKLMGDEVEPRREFIQTNALSVANLRFLNGRVAAGGGRIARRRPRRRPGGSPRSRRAGAGCRARARRGGAGRRRQFLDHAAALHDEQPLAHMRDHGEVVADQEIGEAALARAAPRSRFRISACTETSSAEVGSSSSRICGSRISARAIATRWRWPPESWCG